MNNYYSCRRLGFIKAGNFIASKASKKGTVGGMKTGYYAGFIVLFVIAYVSLTPQIGLTEIKDIDLSNSKDIIIFQSVYNCIITDNIIDLAKMNRLMPCLGGPNNFYSEFNAMKITIDYEKGRSDEQIYAEDINKNLWNGNSVKKFRTYVLVKKDNKPTGGLLYLEYVPK